MTNTMQKVPYDIWTRYDAFLTAKVKDVSHHENLKKWFLYFWDFRIKYHPPDSRSEQVRLFIEKLRQKGQSKVQQKQAAHAVLLYFAMLDAETKAATISPSSQNRATTEGLPLQVSDATTSPSGTGNHNSPYPPLILRGGSEAGGVTIKGRSFNGIAKDEGQPLLPASRPHLPPLSTGRRFNEWRCLEKSASLEWDKVISDLSNEIKTRHYSRKTLKAYADWIRKFQEVG
jgi:hypothetical protein